MFPNSVFALILSSSAESDAVPVQKQKCDEGEPCYRCNREFFLHHDAKCILLIVVHPGLALNCQRCVPRIQANRYWSSAAVSCCYSFLPLFWLRTGQKLEFVPSHMPLVSWVTSVVFTSVSSQAVPHSYTTEAIQETRGLMFETRTPLFPGSFLFLFSSKFLACLGLF